jgi:ElaB/YqjD/DUF883 family membrane-anchored ribosome-binding protein
MSKTSEQRAETKEESADQFSSDFEELKTSFGQLRKDVIKLLQNASESNSDGSIDSVDDTIRRKPLLSVALAIGIGFVAARVFMPHR